MGVRKSSLLCAASLTAMVLIGQGTTAHSADLGLTPAPTHDWTGPYIGALVGVGGLSTFGVYENNENDSAVWLGALGEVGVLGGGQIGWNFQSENIVYGIEGDISATGLNRGVAEPDNNSDVVSFSTDYFATARGRIGIADNDVLFFATGGAAFIGGSLFNSQTDQGLDIDAVGGVVGAGIEWAATPNLSVKVEGLYAMFDHTTDLDGELGESVPGDFFRLRQMAVARLGVNWHFNGSSDRRAYDVDETERDWTGPYIGALVGVGGLQTGGFFDSQDDSSSEIALAQMSNVGLLGGGTAGWNIQNGQMLFGMEGDIAYVDWSETSFQTTNMPDGINLEPHLFATARGRVGFVDGDLLVYGTAGTAFLSGKLTDNGGSSGADNFEFLAIGAVLGAGMEWAATETISIKAEGLYVHFSEAFDFNEAGSADPGDAFEVDDAVIARVGVNWSFR